MRFNGTSAPRRKVGVGGLAVRWAQSRGEWPGSRMTFLEGRFEGASVDIEGPREEEKGLRELDGGARRVVAAEGGGRSAVEGFGGILNVGLPDIGREGGGIKGVGICSGPCFAFELGRAGGGINGGTESATGCV